MMGMINSHKETMVFDWIEAAKIIKERQPQKAVAGLSMDLEWSSGIIYQDNCIVEDSEKYLASKWATPVLILDDGFGIPCFKMESELPGWNAHTVWPDIAKKILNGEKVDCFCIDCGGNQKEHDSTCSYMKELTDDNN